MTVDATRGGLQTPEPDGKKIAADWSARGFSCDLWTDPPGQRWEDFRHATDELVLVLEGQVEFEVTGQVHHPQVGEELLIPAGTIHSARNIGKEAAGLGIAEVVSVPLRDGSGNAPGVFRLAVGALSRLAASHAPVLVQCQYGRSRSPAVVAGYLMGARGLDPFQARALVASKRDSSISAALIPFLFQL